MPVYDYKCTEHGIFHELASLSDSAQPRQCPQCAKLSPRIIMIPPQVLAMAPAKRQAMEHNEKARHEPNLASQVRQDQGGRHACSCDHNTGSAKSLSQTNNLRQQVIFLADGSKVFPSQRPWMISH